MKEDTGQQQNPFTRPGFVTAGIVLGLIIMLGVGVAIVNATRGESSSTSPVSSTPPPNATSTPSAADTAESGSVCGIKGQVLKGRLSIGPETEWEYHGTTAYPTSKKFGPGATDEKSGFRYCFQRSPEGALFTAANAIPQGSDKSVAREWLNYVVSRGPYREELRTDVSEGTSDEGVRIAIVGFRLLAYDGNIARVDIAIRGTVGGRTVTMSAVYEFVWQDGDWKLNADIAKPVNVAEIPDSTGYIAWGE